VPLLGIRRRTIHVLDVALVVWIAVWLLLAARLHEDVSGLTELSDGAVAAGRALASTAEALEVIQGIPFIDREVAELQANVRDAARRTTRAGNASRAEIRTYARLTAATVALGPTVPPLLLYLPLRLAWSRDRRSVARALAAGDRALPRYLAHRALARADAATYSLSTADGDVRPEAVAVLADAELRRLGLRR